MDKYTSAAPPTRTPDPPPKRYPATEAAERAFRAALREMPTYELYHLDEQIQLRRLNLAELTPEDRALFAISVESEAAAIRAELTRRERAGFTSKRPQWGAAIERQRDAIRHHVDIADLLEHEGIPVIRGRTEAHSPCLACGGRDRFIIWPAPDSYAYCRRCGFKTDIFGAAMSLWQVEFPPAVRRLAKTYLGLRAGGAA
jgi:hypothetical protein